MPNPLQQRAVEALAILCTTFGSFFVNSLLFETTQGNEYSGNQLFLVEMGFYVPWFTIASVLVYLAHPQPQKSNFLLIGIATAALLLLSSQGWIDMSLGVGSWLLTWLEVYAHYLVIIPIFYVAGYIAERRRYAVST